jgi:hypothetical protein
MGMNGGSVRRQGVRCQANSLLDIVVPLRLWKRLVERCRDATAQTMSLRPGYTASGKPREKFVEDCLGFCGRRCDSGRLRGLRRARRGLVVRSL